MSFDYQEVYDHGQEVRNLLLIVLAILDDPNLQNNLDYDTAGKLMYDEKIMDKIFELNQQGPKIYESMVDRNDSKEIIEKKLGAVAARYWYMSRDWKQFLTKNNGLVLVCQYLIVILNEIERYRTKTQNYK